MPACVSTSPLASSYFDHDDFVRALSAGRFTPHHMKRYMRGLFSALAHVHAHDYVHRDIKPSNVLYSFRSEHTLVVDFGLVQARRARAQLTLVTSLGSEWCAVSAAACPQCTGGRCPA